MNLEKLTENIQRILPKETAIEGDRVGLQLQSGRTETSKILFAFELCDEVIDEAVNFGADCIITFHPLIWMPLTEIVDNERVGSLVTRLISEKIALISIHTTFDSHIEGSATLLAEKLGIIREEFLVPDKAEEGFGLGLIGRPEKSIAASEFIALLARETASRPRFTEGNSKILKRIALMPGSGSSTIGTALRKNVDALVTADCSYHMFHRVKGKMWLIDPGHYEMEQFIPKGLLDLLVKKSPEGFFDGIETQVSRIRTNPVGQYPDTREFVKMQENLLTNKNGI